MGNLVEPSTVGWKTRLADIEAALYADEAFFSGSGTGTVSDMVLSQLAAPANITVTQTGVAGSTNYSYVVADTGNYGVAPSTAVQTTTGNATLTTGNNNIVSWPGILGHIYNIYRSASSGTPSSTGLIGSVTATVGGTMTFTDTGIAATLNVPTTNTTGSLSPAGPIFANGPVLQYYGGTLQTSAATAGVTLSVANVTNGIFIRSGQTGAVNDQLPTAAALVAALPGVKVGQGFSLLYRNTTATYTITITTNTGITLATGDTNTILTVQARTFYFVFTNVTPGSEAVTVYTGPASAY